MKKTEEQENQKKRRREEGFDASLTKSKRREVWREADSEQEREAEAAPDSRSVSLSHTCLPLSPVCLALLSVVVVVVAAAAALITGGNNVVHQLRLGQNPRDPPQQAALLVRHRAVFRARWLRVSRRSCRTAARLLAARRVFCAQLLACERNAAGMCACCGCNVRSAAVLVPPEWCA